MASSSSSSALVTSPRRKNYYDVFVSFRGTDTRFSFTDHLFAALQRKDISAFRDDTKLQKGESIEPELFHAIEASQVFIVVFSKNYASSTWCLRELEYILYCSQLNGKHVLPVFYDVDPSEVRKQSGGYGEALAKHAEKFQHNSDKVQRWREALTRAGSISGWDVRDKPQSAEIEKIIEHIINILGYKFSSLPKDLVGTDSPIEELEKLLVLNSVDGVRVVGICGMGGIGKTTLTTALYNKISHQFPVCCLIDDLSKIYRRDGPISAQKQILLQTFGEGHLQICNPYNASDLIRSRLRHVKSLIILDNVDQDEQLDKLALRREWLGPGSRIIITSRDEHILKLYGVDVVYKVPLLNESDSLQLFSQKAFKLDHIVSGYDKLAFDILSYASGLPLAIKVLGSFLFDRDIPEWESALARLRESPNKNIMDVLLLSFEGLEKLEKEIFLDIACFFRGYEKQYVTNILNCCGFHPDIGLKILVEKSIIIIPDNGIHMHNLFRELGMKIVQENLTKDSRKWSRLWLPEHFDIVVLENMEKNVEAIVLKHHYSREIRTLAAETLSNMSNLRLLILNDVDVSGSLSYLSNKLRYVAWHEYPFEHLPSSFQPNQLVELDLSYSSIEQLWEGEKLLPNLKTMDLRHSIYLIKMPNFGEVPNLERLNLEGCVNLVQIDPSIGLLTKLVFLMLKNCKNLRSIPNNIFGLSSLKCLNLSGCCKAFNNPKHSKKLDLSESVLHSQSMSSILKWVTMPFHSLYPKVHKGLASCLLSSLASFSFVWELDISFCDLSQIPDALGCMRWLGRLNLTGNNFVRLPSLGELSKLVYLNLQHCKHLNSFPELPLPEQPSSTAIKRCYRSETRWGLHIFNCPELREKERCRNMIFSWMIQFIQANQESYACFHWSGIVIPGSEIPRWFDTQSIDNSASIDLSPIVHDNNFIGLAYCVVFSVTFDDSIAAHEQDWIPETWLHFECDNNQVSFALSSVILDKDLVTVESNHMRIIYIPRESLFDYLSDTTREQVFDFQSNVSTTSRDLYRFTMKIYINDRKGLHVEMKNCGYRCVLKQDLQQFNSTMMHQRNSFDRKRKSLAIEG